MNKVLKGTLKGVGEVGIGLLEGLFEDLPEVSARGAGKFVGKSIAGLRKLELKDESYWWGNGDKSKDHRRNGSPSRVQLTIVQGLEELYPNIYMRLWYRGVQYSDFIRDLRAYYPEVYEDLLNYAPRESPRARRY